MILKTDLLNHSSRQTLFSRLMSEELTPGDVLEFNEGLMFIVLQIINEDNGDYDDAGFFLKVRLITSGGLPRRELVRSRYNDNCILEKVNQIHIEKYKVSEDVYPVQIDLAHC